MNSDTIIDKCVGFHGMFCQESGSSQECIFEIDTFEPNTLTKPANRQFNKKLNLTFIRSTKQIAVLVRKNYAESNNMPNRIWTRNFEKSFKNDGNALETKLQLKSSTDAPNVQTYQ